ncbi:MAG TPA: hypothetical protein VL126_08565 [Bacteroidota bacterium]|nr:hypothetical protein [Bacteroidota bacterium]
MNGWVNFFLAEVGASATLAGLLFVGVSINLSRILSLHALPGCARGSLLLLVTVLIASTLMLIPGQPPQTVGIEILALGLGLWFAIILLDITIWHTMALS